MSRPRRSAFSVISVERILVRGVPATFDQCQRSDRSQPIDVELARAQHRAYVAVLRRTAEVVELPPDDAFPDCVFVEDTVVMLDSTTAFLARPGATSRRGEIGSVADALRDRGVRIVHLDPPGCLDGGDVLRVGDRLVVGLSGRTNDAGARALAAAARQHGIETWTIPSPSGLHLKSSCSLADEATLLATGQSAIDERMATELGVQLEHVDEAFGGNVLALGGGRVIASSASPATARRLRERGLHVQELDISELHKADAALTCPSVRLPAPGAWCT